MSVCPTCNQHIVEATAAEILEAYFHFPTPLANTTLQRWGHTVADLREWYTWGKTKGSLRLAKYWVQRFKNPTEYEKMAHEDDAQHQRALKAQERKPKSDWEPPVNHAAKAAGSVLQTLEEAAPGAATPEEVSEILKKFKTRRDVK
jgi:hypothetical protein